MDEVNSNDKELQKTNTVQEVVNAQVKEEITKITETNFTCTICSELFVEPMTANCGHTFCSFCINKWRTSQNSCPTCRSQVTTLGKTVVIESFLDYMVQKMTPEDQEKRNQVIKERSSKKKPVSELAEVGHLQHSRSLIDEPWNELLYPWWPDPESYLNPSDVSDYVSLRTLLNQIVHYPPGHNSLSEDPSSRSLPILYPAVASNRTPEDTFPAPHRSSSSIDSDVRSVIVAPHHNGTQIRASEDSDSRSEHAYHHSSSSEDSDSRNEHAYHLSRSYEDSDSRNEHAYHLRRSPENCDLRNEHAYHLRCPENFASRNEHAYYLSRSPENSDSRNEHAYRLHSSPESSDCENEHAHHFSKSPEDSDSENEHAYRRRSPENSDSADEDSSYRSRSPIF